jgi:hypothetical protein
MADTPSTTSSDKVIRQDPEDPKSPPVVDFADYATAEAQAKALGKGATVEAIGTAYRVVTADTD